MVTDSSLLGPITFQGKYPEEKFQFYFHQHWIRLLWPLTRTLLLTLLLIGISFVLLSGPLLQEPAARHTTILFLAVIFLFVQFEFLEKFYNYFLYLVIVTDRRIHRIKKTLLVTDDQQSMDLWVLQDINKSQHGLIQCGLGFGTLILEAQETMLRIHFIPRVGQKYQELMHLREKARKQLGATSEPPPPSS